MKHLLTIAFACFAGILNGFADTEAERNLETYNQLKAQLDARNAETNAQKMKNSIALREARNLEASIAQMEMVLSSVGKPDAPQSPSVSAELASPPKRTFLSIKLQSEDDLKLLGVGNPKTFKIGAIEMLPDGLPALRIEVSASAKNKDAKLIHFLDAQKLECKKLLCTVKVKGEDILTSAPGVSGAKFVMCIAKADGKSLWPGADIGGGSFDWREISFSSEMPSDMKSCFLMLGLQGASGKIYYRDLRIEFFDEDGQLQETPGKH